MSDGLSLKMAGGGVCVKLWNNYILYSEELYSLCDIHKEAMLHKSVLFRFHKKMQNWDFQLKAFYR